MESNSTLLTFRLWYNSVVCQKERSFKWSIGYSFQPFIHFKKDLMHESNNKERIPLRVDQCVNERYESVISLGSMDTKFESETIFSSSPSVPQFFLSFLWLLLHRKQKMTSGKKAWKMEVIKRGSLKTCVTETTSLEFPSLDQCDHDELYLSISFLSFFFLSNGRDYLFTFQPDSLVAINP